MKVGTLPWLLRHELRLWWRETISSRSTIIWLVVLGFLGLLFLLPLGILLSMVGSQLALSNLPPTAIWVAVAAWILGFIYTFTQAMGQSVIALFDRGDLDLLVASPVSSKIIFASRLLGVAIQSFISCSLVVVPFSAIAVLIGVPRLLGIYPALISLCLLSASVAMLLTLWLVRLLGARRARTVAQILSAVLTGLFFIAFQLPNLLRDTNVQAPPIWQELQFWFATKGPFGADSWIWFPARTIFFEPISVLATLLISIGLAWLTVETLHYTFVSGTQQAVTQKRRVRSIPETRFSSGLNQIVLLKEWRIIWRNPFLISSTFLQILFLIPALIVVLRGDSSQMIAGFSGFVATASTLIGEGLASTLTRICVSGEEAPDLLKAAPVHSGTLRRLKLLAALIPVWILLFPLFIVLMVRGEPWLPVFIVFLGATTCSAILRLWNSSPIPLTDLFKRRQNTQGDVILGFLELISLMAWVVLSLQVSQSNWIWTLPSLVVIAIVLAIAYWRSRQLGTSLGF
jgi:ABC-2 type transport system permease protein